MIKKLTRNEVSALIPLIEEYIKYYGEKPPIRQQLTEHMEYICQHEESGCCFIAVENDRIVGFATLYKLLSTFQAKHALKMNDFYILPEYRGTEIESKLLQTCKDYFEAGDYAYMEWLESPDNQTAIDLYLKNQATKANWIVFGYKGKAK